MGTEKPAPEAVLRLVKWIAKNLIHNYAMYSNFKKIGLYCTDLCMCCELEDHECDNADHDKVEFLEVEYGEEVVDMNDEAKEY